MKVAYLLVTTAWLVGAQQPPPPTGGTVVGQPPPKVQPTPTPIVAGGPVAATGDCGCNSGCNTCDSGCGGGTWGRFKEWCGGLFRKHEGCDSCGSSCGGCATARPSCFTAQPSCGSCGSGGCASTSCNTCGCSEGYGHRFKEFCGKLFRRHNECDTCNTCNSCGSSYGGAYGGTVIAPKGAEQIPLPKDGVPPKEMPKGPGAGEPPQKQVQIINPGQPAPVPAPTFEAPPAAPAIIPANPTQERPF